MHTSSKPVRKCHGCGLNLRDRCGVYKSPHEMWHNRKRCPGHGNEALLKEYLSKQEHVGGGKGKDARQLRAKQRRTEPHYNGDRHISIAAP